MKKKVISLVLMLVMLASMLPASAFAATDPEPPIEPRLSTAKEVMQSGEQQPYDYQKDGAAPLGTPKDEDVQASVCNEIAVFNANTQSSSAKPSDGKAYVFDSVQDKMDGKSFSSSSYSGNGSGYMDSVAFDPYHTGKNNYIAMLRLVFEQDADGTYIFFLYVSVYQYYDDCSAPYFVRRKNMELKYKLVCAEYDIGALPEFFSIKAACFDGKYYDHLVISFQCNDLSSSMHYGIMILKFKTDPEEIVIVKTLNISDYIENVKSFVEQRSPSCTYLFQRPAIRIATGDFDRDGIDELALVETMPTTKGVLPIKSDASPNSITTEITILDDVLNTCKKVFNGRVMQSKGSNNYNMLFAAGCASGDIDGNRCDALIVAGYWGTATTSSDKKTMSSSFDPETDNYGIVFVQFNGKEYIMSDVNTVKLNSVTKGAVADCQRIAWTWYSFPNVALETAAMRGFGKPCSIFLNGDILDYSGASLIKVHTHKAYGSSNADTGDSGYDGYFITYNVIKGNLNNDEMGRQSFGFMKNSLIFDLKGSVMVNNYAMFICPSYADGEGNISHYDDFTGGVESGSGGWHPNSKSGHLQACCCMTSLDVQDDGVKCRYVGTDYVYSDPQLLAVLQAAPYFKELGNWNTFMGSTSYSITTAYGHTSAGSNSWQTDVGIMADAEIGFSAVNVAAHLSVGWVHSNTDSWSESYTATDTSTFTACSVDTVVLRRIPLQMYYYQVWDNEKGDWQKDDKGEPIYSIMTTRLSPTFFQMSLDEYNKFVDEYNVAIKDVKDAIKFKKIQTSAEGQDIQEDYVEVLPFDAIGNPKNYYTEGQITSKTYISKPYALGIGGQSATDAHDYVETTSDGHSYSNGIHVNFSIAFGGKLGPFAKLQVGPYIDFNYTWEKSQEDSKSNGYGGSGTVCNIDVVSTASPYLPENRDCVKQYGFTWRFAGWKAVLTSQVDDAGNKVTVPVYGYALSDVTYPGQAPNTVFAQVDKSNNVVVTWKQPLDIAKKSPTNRSIYRVYRLMQEDGAKLQELGTVDINAKELKFSEPYSNLLKGKNYTYYVGCDYDGPSGKYAAISFIGSNLTGGMNGISKPEEKKIETTPENTTQGSNQVQALNTPTTGDKSDVMLGIALLGVAAFVTVACVLPVKRKKTK